MKLSDVFNVDFELYARNKDYSKYSLPPLRQFFGLDLLKLIEKIWWDSEKHDFLSFSSNSDITLSSDFLLNTKCTPKNINSVMQCILDKGKYALKEHDGRYIFEVVGDNSGASWAQQSTSVGSAPVGLAVYDGKLYCTCRGSNDVYLFDGSSWSKSGDVGDNPHGLAVYDGKLYCTCYYYDDIYVFAGSSWSKSGDVGGTPRGLAVYDGKLYCTCQGSDDIYVFGNGKWVSNTNANGYGSQDEIQAEITSTDIILDVNGTQTSISYSFSLATNSLDLYVGKSYGGSVAVGYSGGYPETFKGSIENLKITKNGSVTFRKP